MAGQTFTGTVTINAAGQGWCILASTDGEYAANFTTSHPQGVGMSVGSNWHGIEASGNAIGVQGTSISAGGLGIKGYSAVWDGVDGQNGGASSITPNPNWGAGVRGESQSGFGVIGLCQSGIGVRAENNSAGNAAIQAVNHAGGNAGWFDGSVQVNGSIHVTGDVLLNGADCAERFELAAHAEAMPGMVMAADTNGLLHPANTAYDPGVVGIVSGAGNFRPGITLGCGTGESPNAVIALSGRAFCKVSNAGGPIRVGDLLTTSPLAGSAMKAERTVRSLGCIVGKALRNATGNEDLIPVLVFRQ